MLCHALTLESSMQSSSASLIQTYTPLIRHGCSPSSHCSKQTNVIVTDSTQVKQTALFAGSMHNIGILRETRLRLMDA